MNAVSRYSCIYRGWIRHRRFVPGEHSFTYPLFMMYLDLDELPEVFAERWYSSMEKFNLVQFKRSDYFGFNKGVSQNSAEDLKRSVIEELRKDASRQGLALPEIERVAMLSHLRYCNVLFNPVSFYYCFDAYDRCVAILSEITNTPWGERHHYNLFPGHSSKAIAYQSAAERRHQFEFDKAFHVSPFNPMNMQYRWNFAEPDHRCVVHMENRLLSGETVLEKHFDASLSMKRYPLSQLASTLIRFPNICVSVVVGIYWQALQLWLKRMPFYDHPETEGKEAVSHDQPGP